jgi:hypothetical protein
VDPAMAKIETTVTPVIAQPGTLKPMKFRHIPIVLSALDDNLSSMRETESLPSIKQILQNKPQINIDGYEYTKLT